MRTCTKIFVPVLGGMAVTLLVACSNLKTKKSFASYDLESKMQSTDTSS